MRTSFFVILCATTIFGPAPEVTAKPGELVLRLLAKDRKAVLGYQSISRVLGIGDVQGTQIMGHLVQRGWTLDGNGLLLSKDRRATILTINAPHRGARDLFVHQLHEGRLSYDFTALRAMAEEMAHYRAGGYESDHPIRVAVTELMNDTRTGVVISAEEGSNASTLTGFHARWVHVSMAHQSGTPVDNMLHEFTHSLQIGPGAYGDYMLDSSLERFRHGGTPLSTAEARILKELWGPMYVEMARPGMAMGDAWIPALAELSKEHRYGRYVRELGFVGANPFDVLDTLTRKVGLMPFFPEFYLLQQGRR